VCKFSGTNFSDVVQQARRDGYPRIIDADEREVTEWRPVTGYDFDEATP
jgi:hypothetical protein